MVLSSRETSSHESSVNGEPGWRVMIWVMQAGRWGFGALFHKHFNSKEWPQAEACSPAGWSSNTLLEWRECGMKREQFPAVPRGGNVGGVRRNHRWLQHPDSGD